MFKQNGSSLDSKSTKDLKNLIEEYRLSQMDLLDDSYQKRSNVKDCRTRLHSLIIKLENYDIYKDMWTIEKITEELKEINKDLTKRIKKYDYSKLPKDNPYKNNLFAFYKIVRQIKRQLYYIVKLCNISCL